MEFADDYARICQRCCDAQAKLSSEFAGERDAAFEALALEVFDFQLRWNANYRNFAAGRDVDGWKSIPAVPAAAFKDLDRPLTCFPIEQAEGFFETSGTSGEVKGRHYFYDFDMYRTAIEASLEPLRRIGMPLDLRRHWLPGMGERSSLRFMFEFLSGEGPVDNLEFDAPVLLMGTALGFLHLFEAGCGRLPAGSWALETGGYKGSGRELSKPDLYAMFAEQLGVPAERIVNEYGMTELSSQFYAHGADGFHAEAQLARAVVRSPETGLEVEIGEVGYLTLYDLANVGSVMAVATQDIARRGEGGSFQLLGRDPAAVPRGCSRAADEFLSK
jgi:hypothetical protein